MEFPDFSAIFFGSEFDMRLVCTKLNNIVRAGIWFSTVTVQNTKWMWVVKNMVAAMNSDLMLCGAFGLYPGYVAGILKHVEEIHFYVVCSDKLTYSDYIEKAVSVEQCNTCVLCEENYFKLWSGGETIILKFETRIMEGKNFRQSENHT